MGVEEDKKSVVESFSLTRCLSKGRRQGIVKLLISENRILSRPLNMHSGLSVVPSTNACH